MVSSAVSRLSPKAKAQLWVGSSNLGSILVEKGLTIYYSRPEQGLVSHLVIGVGGKEYVLKDYKLPTSG